MAWSMFNPCSPCCSAPPTFDVAVAPGVMFSQSYQGLYPGAGYTLTTFDQNTDLTSDRLRLIIIGGGYPTASSDSFSTRTAAELLVWLNKGNRRLYLLGYGLWATTDGDPSEVAAYTTKATQYNTNLNTLCAGLGVSLRVVNGTVGRDEVTLQPAQNSACFDSGFSGSHYLIAGLTDYERVSGFGQVRVAVPGLEQFYCGFNPVTGGTRLTPDAFHALGYNYTTGTSMAVERLSAVNSEVVVNGAMVGQITDGVFFNGVTCEGFNTAFLLRLIELDVP